MANRVTIVNRTKGVLEGTWDGRHYEIPTGESSWTEYQAMAFKRQNPIMGTQDQRTLSMQYLIGIKEHGDPITPTEQSDAIELWSADSHSRPVEVRPGRGLSSAREIHSGQPSGTNFVAP